MSLQAGRDEAIGTDIMESGIARTPDSELTQSLSPVIARIAEGAVERELSRALPHAEMRLLADSGFGALRLPRAAGGRGASLRQLFGLLIDLAAADPNVAQAWRFHFVFVDELLLTNAAVSGRWQDEVARGKVFGNAFAERPDSQGTKLTEDGAEPGYLLNGAKYYSTGTIFSDYIQVACDLNGGFANAIVRTHASGVEIVDDWDGFGQRMTGSGSTVFRDVRVDAGDIFDLRYREAPAGYASGFAQLVHLACLAGIVQRMVDDVGSRITRRRPGQDDAALPKDDPFVQSVIGSTVSAAYCGRAIVLETAGHLESAFNTADKEAADTAESLVYQAQVALIPMVLAAITDAFEAAGGSLVSEKLCLDRHWRNARTISVHNPVHKKTRVIGEELLDRMRGLRA